MLEAGWESPTSRVIARHRRQRRAKTELFKKKQSYLDRQHRKDQNPDPYKNRNSSKETESSGITDSGRAKSRTFQKSNSSKGTESSGIANI
jgi:hypothetical protein